jgi:hypothetical protein
MRSLTQSKLQKNKKPYENKWNEYLLYVKSIILQINEELDMKMLTYRSLEEKTKLIINNIKKCNT